MVDLSYFHGIKIVEGSISSASAPTPGGGGTAPPDPDPQPDYAPALDFSDDRNSQFIGQVI